MSTSNTSAGPKDIFDAQAAADLRAKRKDRIAKSLSKRHRKEKIFRIAGFSAVMAGLFFVALLLAVF